MKKYVFESCPRISYLGALTWNRPPVSVFNMHHTQVKMSCYMKFDNIQTVLYLLFVSLLPRLQEISYQRGNS